MKFKKKFKTISIVLGVILLLTGCLIYHFFFSMNSLPEGEYICESISPQGTYTVKIYETNPALSVGGTRGELVNNRNGKKKNIYWEYNRNLPLKGTTEEDVIWESDETVIINGKKLNVKKDVYDYRRE